MNIINTLFSTISIPSFLYAFTVVRVSPAFKKFFTTDVPSAKEDKIIALCEIDLSDGTLKDPSILFTF
jgi:hypothetical protein